ncbi:hypothetical protein [Actinacidiphila acidipaludis]|uniref:Uncharacterized protein n=1 Tax=Actinacidiphila acidipaludis TaxID=2873382 RepID=A0ABS7Q2V4_9ACTN|nr:hypothetical protein [Streptomyces acidipaludis]MBY8877483.1 hypothetical protein [Streptomyces acidipaludis]
MSEQQDALEDLASSDVLVALAWANASAYRRTMEDFDPDTGHDQGWVGSTAHRLFCDRLHRVFSTGRHGVAELSAASEGLDTVAAGLFPGEYEKMPAVVPGEVTWSHLNRSPGWRSGRWRFLLASFVYGESDAIPWSQKSPTKRRVASQAKPEGWLDTHPMLPFDDGDDPSLMAVLQALAEEPEDSELTTLIVAHSVNLDLGLRELYLGRSRLNRGGGEAWYWKHDLLASDFGTPGSGPIPVTPSPRPAPSGVQDAPVRLRRAAREGNDK